MKSFLPDLQSCRFQLPALPKVWAQAKRLPPLRSRSEHQSQPALYSIATGTIPAHSQSSPFPLELWSATDLRQCHGGGVARGNLPLLPPSWDLPRVHLQPGFQLPSLWGIGASEDLATLHVDHFDREIAHLACLVQWLRNQSQAAGQYFDFSASKQSLDLHQHLQLRPNPPQDHRNNRWEEQNGRLLEKSHHQRTGKAQKLTRFNILL